jgi:hypothetical protein
MFPQEGDFPCSQDKIEYLVSLGLKIPDVYRKPEKRGKEVPLQSAGELFIGSLSAKAQAFRTTFAAKSDSRAAKGKTFYAVHYGELDGEVIKDFITESWIQCRRLVTGVSGCIFKGFRSMAKAREYLEEQKRSHVHQPENSQRSFERVATVSRNPPAAEAQSWTADFLTGRRPSESAHSGEPSGRASRERAEDRPMLRTAPSPEERRVGDLEQEMERLGRSLSLAREAAGSKSREEARSSPVVKDPSPARGKPFSSYTAALPKPQ